MGERSITYAVIDMLVDLYSYRLSTGDAELVGMSLFGLDYKTKDGKELRISIGGEWELTLEVFRDLILAMMVAIFFIYLVLVAQFESFKGPLIIMSTIPLSVIGVFPGLALINLFSMEYFTATSMIGIIALAGIAVNNSIILMEYVKDLRKKGRPLNEAVIEASVTRFRPIMLTTITTVLGSMTILGDPVWSGLAYAIILGLGMSSVLILLVFPVLYTRLYRH